MRDDGKRNFDSSTYIVLKIASNRVYFLSLSVSASRRKIDTRLFAIFGPKYAGKYKRKRLNLNLNLDNVRKCRLCYFKCV